MQIKNERIKGFFEEKEYEKFQKWLDEEFDYFDVKYAYLGLSKEREEALFNEILDRVNSKEEIYDILVRKLANYAHNFILHDFAINDTRIFSNMLILLLNADKNRLRVLKTFLRELENNGLDLNEEFLSALKDKSKVFKDIIKTLGMEDFMIQDFLDFGLGKFDVYYDLRGSASLKETVNIADYWNYFKGSPNLNSLKELNRSYFNKIRLLVQKNNTICALRLYIGTFIEVPRIVFDLFIFNLDTKVIMELLEEFNHHKCLNKASLDKLLEEIKWYIRIVTPEKLGVKSLRDSLKKETSLVDYLIETLPSTVSLSRAFKRDLIEEVIRNNSENNGKLEDLLQRKFSKYSRKGREAIKQLEVIKMDYMARLEIIKSDLESENQRKEDLFNRYANGDISIDEYNSLSSSDKKYLRRNLKK